METGRGGGEQEIFLIEKGKANIRRGDPLSWILLVRVLAESEEIGRANT